SPPPPRITGNSHLALRNCPLAICAFAGPDSTVRRLPVTKSRAQVAPLPRILAPMPFAVYVLAIAAFAIGTAEFIVSGILPPLAADLEVTIPAAGLLVTAYALGVAIGGPIFSVLTARFAPRNVLIVVMLVFTGSQVLCALAPDYGMLLLARV